jgi:hypothetical protein
MEGVGEIQRPGINYCGYLKLMFYAKSETKTFPAAQREKKDAL